MVFLIQQTMVFAVPLLIVALAGVFAERSGIINLALEGIMIFGAFIGVLFIQSAVCFRSGRDGEGRAGGGRACGHGAHAGRGTGRGAN